MEWEYKSVKIVQNGAAFHLYLNRPGQLNALSRDFFTEFPKAMAALDQNPDVGVVILAGSGRHFCSGIDLKTLSDGFEETQHPDRARNIVKLQRHIRFPIILSVRAFENLNEHASSHRFLQDAISAIEGCRKPVIAAIHGACIGGAVDIITACDIRYCSSDAFFSVKEVDLAITADLGTLQRLPAIVGFGNAMELALTARRFSASEAKEMRLVTTVFASKDALLHAVQAIAQEIASKSPIAVIGTKATLLKGRDMTVEQGLNYVATWNSGVLVSEDMKEAISAHSQKRKPTFAKL